MSKQRDRDEFVALLAKEGISVDVTRKLLRAAKRLQLITELECSSEAADRDRVPCPAVKNSAYECCCDYQAGKHSDVPRVSAQSKRIEYRVRQLCMSAGLAPIFGGDPRGAVLKLQPPSGQTNDWGQAGVCVPV